MAHLAPAVLGRGIDSAPAAIPNSVGVCTPLLIRPCASSDLVDHAFDGLPSRSISGDNEQEESWESDCFCAAKQVFTGLSISPDGRRLAYILRSGGKAQLWIRSMDSLTAQPLSGSATGTATLLAP